MTQNWKDILVPYKSAPKLAEVTLIDEYGQPLIGIREIRVKSVALKFLSSQDTYGCLCSNLLTSYILNESGSIEHIFSSIKIIDVKGRSGYRQLLNIDSTSYFIQDISEVKFWIQVLIFKAESSKSLNFMFGTA